MEVVISKSEGVRGNKGKYSYTSDTGEFRPRMSNSALVFLKRVLSREHMLPQMLPLTDRFIITYCKYVIKIRIPPFMITGGAFEITRQCAIPFGLEGYKCPLPCQRNTYSSPQNYFPEFDERISYAY
jgi:hypothetical protein